MLKTPLSNSCLPFSPSAIYLLDMIHKDLFKLWKLHIHPQYLTKAKPNPPPQKEQKKEEEKKTMFSFTWDESIPHLLMPNKHPIEMTGLASHHKVSMNNVWSSQYSIFSQLIRTIHLWWQANFFKFDCWHQGGHDLLQALAKVLGCKYGALSAMCGQTASIHGWGLKKLVEQCDGVYWKKVIHKSVQICLLGVESPS